MKKFFGHVKILEKVFIEPYLVPYFIYKLKKETSKAENIDNFIRIAFNLRLNGLNIKPTQVEYEIKKLLIILKKIKPKNLIEIGTAKGGTLYLFCQVAHPEAKIISIDLPGWKFDGGYPKYKIPLYRSFAKENQKIYLIRDDSHKKET